jgi:DMSO/TMAO reductase YedYZ molybdopterin-dependent catalytic subunit
VLSRTLENRYKSIRRPFPTLPQVDTTGGVVNGTSICSMRRSPVTPFITAASDFYRIDKALHVSAIDRRYKIEIGGMVDTPMTLTYADCWHVRRSSARDDVLRLQRGQAT